MTQIKIGADELILWLRKNGKAVNKPNDGTHGLGFEIKRIIESLGGHIVAANYECYWANKDGEKNIGQFQLPQKAAQYEIDVNHLSKLFETIINL